MTCSKCRERLSQSTWLETSIQQIIKKECAFNASISRLWSFCPVPSLFKVSPGSHGSTIHRLLPWFLLLLEQNLRGSILQIFLHPPNLPFHSSQPGCLFLDSSLGVSWEVNVRKSSMLRQFTEHNGLMCYPSQAIWLFYKFPRSIMSLFKVMKPTWWNFRYNIEMEGKKACGVGLFLTISVLPLSQHKDPCQLHIGVGASLIAYPLTACITVGQLLWRTDPKQYNVL